MDGAVSAGPSALELYQLFSKHPMSHSPLSWAVCRPQSLSISTYTAFIKAACSLGPCWPPCLLCSYSGF